MSITSVEARIAQIQGQLQQLQPASMNGAQFAQMMSGATAAYYKAKGLDGPPADGPLAAITPGTPGALITMLAEYGTLPLAEVLAPAIELADGYAIDAETANEIEAEKAKLKQWRYSKAVMLPHAGEAREAPAAGEVFRQPDLAATLRKLVEAEAAALAAGKSRKEALEAAYERSDVCAVPAASVIIENVVSFEIARALVDKFGGDSLTEMEARWKLYEEMARQV